MKFAAPQYACKGIDLPGGRKIDFRKGIADVSSKADIAALAAAGAFPVSNQPHRSGGFKCPECHFSTWFRQCSKCGSACVKEIVNAQTSQD